MNSAPHTLFPSTLQEDLFGTVIVVRPASRGMVEAGIFLIDMGCLGVKDAEYFKGLPAELDLLAKKFMPGGTPQRQTGAWGRKLVEEAAAYARSLGFAPHSDYKKAARVFGGIRADDCDEQFVFGRDGKPLFVQGPYDDEDRVDRVLAVLEAKLGQDGFHYVVAADEVDADGEGGALPGILMVGESGTGDMPPGSISRQGFLSSPGADLEDFVGRMEERHGGDDAWPPLPHMIACITADLMHELFTHIMRDAAADGQTPDPEAVMRSVVTIHGLAQLGREGIERATRAQGIEMPHEDLLDTAEQLHATMQASGLPPVMLREHELVGDPAGDCKLLVLLDAIEFLPAPDEDAGD